MKLKGVVKTVVFEKCSFQLFLMQKVHQIGNTSDEQNGKVITVHYIKTEVVPET